MSEIKPALSKAEWEMEGHFPLGLHLGAKLKKDANGQRHLYIQDKPRHACYVFPTAERHALAALCLHEQEYGFTWKMVDALERAAAYDSYCLDSETRAEIQAAASRLSALLPPRE